QRARLHVAFAPDAPGRRTTVELSLRVLPAATGAAPSPLRGFALRLPAGMGIATTTLGEANCAPAALLAHGIGGCSPNALLGFGAATATIPLDGRAIGERSALYPLMGPPAENRVEVLFYLQSSSPVFAQLVLPATLSEDTPPFGEQLQATMPAIEAWPEGPDLSLQTFAATLGPLHLTYHRRVGGREVAFHPRGVRIPASCPAGGYPFAAVLGFADGSTTTAAYSVPCPRG
ncbi:MAG TPA: hypothetical protein VMS02_05800, partial [Solirubrobacteraceae bacterium]|nr:hypothetical protein [Solirubrobacteraceae bacterium]